MEVDVTERLEATMTEGKLREVRGLEQLCGSRCND